MIPKLYRTIFAPYLAPAGGEADGSADRGDDYVPPAEPDKTPTAEEKAAADLAAEKLETELKAKDEDKDDDKEEVDADGKPKKAAARIPLARHEAVLAKEREKRQELERQLANFQQGKQVAATNAEITKLEDSVLEMEAEYNKLVTDGKAAEATTLMGKLRATERQLSEAKSDLKIQAAESRAVERGRYTIVLERIEASFPKLNPDHADFDEELQTEVVELKDAYQRQGKTPAEALQKAVTILLGATNTKQEVAVTTKPRVDAIDVAADRKKEAVKKVADAVDKTPANLSKSGQDGDKLGGGKLDAKAVMGMKYEEFSKLNEETLAELRGDNL